VSWEARAGALVFSALSREPDASFHKTDNVGVLKAAQHPGAAGLMGTGSPTFVKFILRAPPSVSRSW